MTQWEYVKGGEADFKGAPEWCTHVSRSPEFRKLAWECSSRVVKGNSYQWVGSKIERTYSGDSEEELEIVAERRKVDNLQSRVNDANLGDALKDIFKGTAPSHNKYNRQCKGVTIDVYHVLLAFNVTNPALQHLVKKALCTGLRGHKDKSQDLQDILDSAKRALELESDK